MRHLWLCLALLSAFAVSGAELVLDFNKFPVDQAPSSFRSILWGRGQLGDWKVVLDNARGSSASTPSLSMATPQPRVLAQLSTDETDERFPILAYESARFRDFTLTTFIKNVSGTVEQMAGIAFRGQDEKNFYYVRLSSKGNSFRFFKVIGGQRGEPIGPDMEIASGVWHKLDIECKGNSFRFLLNGQVVIPTLTDNSFSSGWVGFLTKSDSVAYFGETKIVYTPQKILAESLVEEALQRYPRLAGLRVFGATRIDATIRILASKDPKEVGTKAAAYVAQVMQTDKVFYGLTDEGPAVTFPLHDRNGEALGAVQVTLERFFGQADVSATSRATPVAKLMESRAVKARDLSD